jgi:uncharacterized protein
VPDLIVLLLAGVFAGVLGGLLGLGGGIILVPLLNAGMGLPFHEAAAVSLVGVLATSSSVAASSQSRPLLNERLAAVLLVFSVGGATIGARILNVFSESTYERVFGITAAVVAVVMIARLERRNVQAPVQDEGALGGHIWDPDTGRRVSYRLRRLPLAALTSFMAGLLASFVGVGGGILIVPVLNAWCGVPIRVAAAASAFMVGITAVPGAVAHWAEGYLGDYHLAGACSLGVLVGYRLGLFLTTRVRVRWLKMLMSVLLIGVAVEYLFLR